MRLTHDDRMRRISATLLPALLEQQVTRAKIQRSGAITPKSMILRNWGAHHAARRDRARAMGGVNGLHRMDRALRDPKALAASIDEVEK